MNTTKTFLRKSSQIVIAVAVSLQLTQCDSSTDLTVNPNANFDLDNRYNKDELDANLSRPADLPKFLVSGDRIIIDAIELEDDVDTIVRSSGQVFLGDFRFNYNSRFSSGDNEGSLVRSDDHAVIDADDSGNLLSSLLTLRDSGNGSGSLAEALTIDASKISTELNLISFTQEQRGTIRDAIKSLGYIVKDDLDVLGNQYIYFYANSTNQLLIDENKITGEIVIVKTWQNLLFKHDTITTDDDEPTVVSGEYEISLGDAEQQEIIGTFEIQLNSL